MIKKPCRVIKTVQGDLNHEVNVHRPRCRGCPVCMESKIQKGDGVRARRVMGYLSTTSYIFRSKVHVGPRSP